MSSDRLDTLTEITFTINERLDKLEKVLGGLMVTGGLFLIVYALNDLRKR